MIEKLSRAIERGWDAEAIYHYYVFKTRGSLNEEIVRGMLPSESRKWFSEFKKTSRWLADRLPSLDEKVKRFVCLMQTQMRTSQDSMATTSDCGMFAALFSSIYDTHYADKFYGKLVCNSQIKKEAKEKLLEKLPTLYTVANMTLANGTLSTEEMGLVLNSLQRMNEQLELYSRKEKTFDKEIRKCLNESQRLTAMYTKWAK